MKRMGLSAMLVCAMFCTSVLAADTVSTASLLDELSDRSAIASFPAPEYTCQQASSYDRNSVASDQPGWFDNNDSSKYGNENLNIIRTEMHDGKEEWVLLDAEGPGAIVRWWITSKEYKTQFRVYLDGAETPTIEAKLEDLLGGDFLAGYPLSDVAARGRNLFVPIPYAKRCKITLTEPQVQERLYYQINYRTYAPGTRVETFTMKQWDALKDRVAQVQNELLAAPALDPFPTKPFTLAGNGKPWSWSQKFRSPQIVDGFSFRVDAGNTPEVVQALRSTVLVVRFDGQETVRVPFGDFFGGGVGINPYQARYTSVDKDGTLSCFWPMPCKQSVEFELINHSKFPLKITPQGLRTHNAPWTARSMYFHAGWRQERDIKTPKPQDWNYIALAGKGVFVGDVLSLQNNMRSWWGEGDEKIYVDGESFPSHFGTGTEDYYGYAWCTPEYFSAPFHTQPRAEGPQNYGNVTNGRFRGLDGIPFQKSFVFDMEIWTKVLSNVNYSALCFWYGTPQTKAVDAPLAKRQTSAEWLEEIKAEVLYHQPMRFSFPGFVLNKMPAGNLKMQNLQKYATDTASGTWTNDDHLWWTEASPGDQLELIVELPRSGSQRLLCNLTKAPNYGRVQFWLDNQKVGEPIDLYHESVVSSGEIEIGRVDAAKGTRVLSIELLDKNKASKGTMFGIDTYRFE